MIRILFVSVCLMLGGLFVDPGARAQQAQGILSPEQVEVTRGNLMMARGLLAYGTEKKDPYAIMTAVRIFADQPGRILADGESGPTGKDLDLTAELDKAATYAKGNEALTKTIAEMKTQMAPKITTSNRAAQAKGCVWRYWCNCCNCWYAWACW
jgi:hypothetical protein